MAGETGISSTSVHRYFKLFGLQPHRTDTFKLSTDAFFIEKLRDVVGLYLSPPENALVLCVDEKSQVQALERTQPMLPMGMGYVEGVTHDYKRHGTTTLFAALNVLNGAVLAECKPRHRHQEFLSFLRAIDKASHLVAFLIANAAVPRSGVNRCRRISPVILFFPCVDRCEVGGGSDSVLLLHAPAVACQIAMA